MGWIRQARSSNFESSLDSSTKVEAEISEHVEDIKNASSTLGPALQSLKRKYNFAAEDVLDEELPLIPKHEVLARRRKLPGKNGDSISSSSMDEGNGEIWIVVDNIVYDCSHFVSEHPGGMDVILSFAGEDCSWQFWRFHGKNEMEQYGRALRVGRTEGITNRFKEFPRFIGLRGLGDDWSEG